MTVDSILLSILLRFDRPKLIVNVCYACLIVRLMIFRHNELFLYLSQVKRHCHPSFLFLFIFLLLMNVDFEEYL